MTAGALVAQFFIPEHTGFLFINVSIAAFVFLMRTTASVDWENKW